MRIYQTLTLLAKPYWGKGSVSFTKGFPDSSDSKNSLWDFTFFPGPFFSPPKVSKTRSPLLPLTHEGVWSVTFQKLPPKIPLPGLRQGAATPTPSEKACVVSRCKRWQGWSHLALRPPPLTFIQIIFKWFPSLTAEEVCLIAGSLPEAFMPSSTVHSIPQQHVTWIYFSRPVVAPNIL